MYKLKNYCIQTKDIIDNGTTHIIINYSLYELMKDKELLAFCKYCKTKEVSNELTKEIENMIRNIKQNELAKKEYSFLFNRYPDDIQLAIKRSENKGIKKGIKKGIEKGIEKGKLEGSYKAKIDTAKKLIKMGYPHKNIAEATGLSESEIAKL